jgi:hypothetical protein
MVMLAVEINYFTYQWVASVAAGAFRHASTATSRRETRSLSKKGGVEFGAHCRICQATVVWRTKDGFAIVSGIASIAGSEPRRR